MIETSNGVSTSKTTQIDQWGRPTEYQQITDGQTYTSKYSYNLSGALIEEEYPSGKKVKNDFDANGDVERVWGTNGASNQMYANAFNYTASGGIASMRLGNGQWETAKFNNRLQVEELGLGHSATDAGTWKVNYEFGEYNPNSQTVTGSKNTGNIARQTVSFDGLSESFVQTYQYDSLYRLTGANEKAGSTENWKQNFTYDRYANRLTHAKFISGSQITHNSQTHPTIDPNTNRFSAGQSYGYDKVGNLVTDANGRTFTFDGNNKQRYVTDGNNATVGEYFYDGDGMRVKKHLYTAGNHTKTVIFVYSGGKLVEEYSTDPPQNPKTKYLTEDHLGTPRVITDGAGQVVSRRDFMPFGEQIANTTGTRSDNSFKYASSEDDVNQKFTGYQQDGETMLDFAEARMYENRHARFTAVDPLLASGNSANPQTFNRYVYVGNSPLIMTDPTGLVGDYYDRRTGEYLGYDEKNDGLIYFADLVKRTDKHNTITNWKKTTIEKVNKLRSSESQLPTTERVPPKLSETSSVSGRATFYRNFQQNPNSNGTNWAGAASKVAQDVDMLTFSSAQYFGYSNPELSDFANTGNRMIFEDAFPKLTALQLGAPLSESEAFNFDSIMLAEEQSLIQPLYDNLSPNSFNLLNDAVRGNFTLSNLVPSNSRFFPQNRNIKDVTHRWEFGMKAMGYDVTPDQMPIPNQPYVNGEMYNRYNRQAPIGPFVLKLQF